MTPTSTSAGANGQLDFWIDGTEYGPWSNRWFRTTSALAVDIMWLNLYADAAHPDMGIRQDNLVVSTQRIGCIGTSTPGPLPTPTNLRRVDRAP